MVTWRQLSRGLVQNNGRGRIRSTDELRAIVELLEEHGDLKPDRTWTRGERWILGEAGARASADAHEEPAEEAAR
jgi:hypothetical protein